jgi:ApaG protein
MTDLECTEGPAESLVMYSAVTRSIKVSVKPLFLEDQSSPAEHHFVWAYQVRIENTGRETVQLRMRHWRITDSFGRVQEVRGPGVVGEQPVLEPGEAFEYTSGTPLTAPSGIMVGTYQMETEGGETFDVAIPAFSLDSPHETIHLN